MFFGSRWEHTCSCRSGALTHCILGGCAPWKLGRLHKWHHKGLMGCVLGVLGRVRGSGLTLGMGILINILEECSQEEIRIGRRRPSFIPARMPGCSGFGRTGTAADRPEGGFVLSSISPRGPRPIVLYPCSAWWPACEPAPSVRDHFSLSLHAL